jgi:hypothetical protein
VDSVEQGELADGTKVTVRAGREVAVGPPLRG